MQTVDIYYSAFLESQREGGKDDEESSDKKKGAGNGHDDEEEEDDDEDDPLDVAFAFYNILLRLSDFTGLRYFEMDKFNPDLDLSEKLEDSKVGYVCVCVCVCVCAVLYVCISVFVLCLCCVCVCVGVCVCSVVYASLLTFLCCSLRQLFKVHLAMAKETVSIEILRNDRLQKIHFLNKYAILLFVSSPVVLCISIISTVCMHRWSGDLRDEARHDLLWHVDRSSPTNKIVDFVNRAK